MCSFCGNEKVHAKGFCHKCYLRYLRSGSPNYVRNVRPVSIGDKFGKFVVVERLDNNMFNCQCECGNFKIVNGSNLKNEHPKSCGCLASKRDNSKNSTNQDKESKDYRRKYYNFSPRTAKQKKAFELYCLGMSYTEIGKELGVSRQNVGYMLKSCSC